MTAPMDRDEMLRRLQQLLDAAWADEAPPAGIDPAILAAVTDGDAVEADRRSDSPTSALDRSSFASSEASISTSSGSQSATNLAKRSSPICRSRRTSSAPAGVTDTREARLSAGSDLTSM